MFNLYITADRVGLPDHGGGSVTFHESRALKTLGPCQVVDRQILEPALVSRDDPWCWDATFASGVAVALRNMQGAESRNSKKIAHFYSGTWTRSITLLKRMGYTITHTAAAHDIDVSRREHEKLGIPYNYPHLTNPDLWQRYVGGYLAADLVICPSRHSADCMQRYGCKNVVVIPHGVTLPETVAPLPSRFTVGYLGAYGPDKGVRYLLEAWKRLNYSDATLILAGRDSTSPFVRWMVEQFGGGNISLVGWVPDVSAFYNSLTLYAQPSVSEGFGLEVLEAMAHGRPVVVSDGAGASDLWVGGKFSAGDVDDFCIGIDGMRNLMAINGEDQSKLARSEAEKYTWDKIRQQYIDVWKGLLS